MIVPRSMLVLFILEIRDMRFLYMIGNEFDSLVHAVGFDHRKAGEREIMPDTGLVRDFKTIRFFRLSGSQFGYCHRDWFAWYHVPCVLFRAQPASCF